MKVSDKDVACVADLANLELTGDERARMLRDLNSILEYVERLGELGTPQERTRAEAARMLRDLNSILEYVERLGELETGKVPPMAQLSDRYGVDESRQGSDRFAYA